MPNHKFKNVNFGQPKNVMLREMPDGEAILLNVDTEKYFSLDKIGASVLSALINSNNYDEALNTMKTKYEVDQAELKRDMDELIENLINNGLLEEINE